MKFNRRYEHKYRIDLFKYYQIKMYLKMYANPDKYTKISKRGKYLVRSLYFDNSTLDAFHEKENGNWGRIKFRIRSYKENVEDDDVLSFELKTKKGDIMEKYSKFISVKDYKQFMSGKYQIEDDDKLMIEIERLRKIRSLEPMLIVEYEREGYASKLNDENVRITFDHNIKYARSKDLFPEYINYRKSCSKEIILEIKCRDEMPYWLSKMIKMYNLKKVANSKFAYGMQTINNDIITINNYKNVSLLPEMDQELVRESSFSRQGTGMDEYV